MKHIFRGKSFYTLALITPLIATDNGENPRLVSAAIGYILSCRRIFRHCALSPFSVVKFGFEAYGGLPLIARRSPSSR